MAGFTSARPLPPARKADVPFYPGCSGGVPEIPAIAIGGTGEDAPASSFTDWASKRALRDDAGSNQ
jgi:hypothetical protein